MQVISELHEDGFVVGDWAEHQKLVRRGCAAHIAITVPGAHGSITPDQCFAARRVTLVLLELSPSTDAVITAL
jgi:hypothetical protein